MTGFDPRTTLETMQSLVCREDLDLTQRDASDLEFRQLYRLLAAQEDGVPDDVQEEVRQALLALVGNDDWSAACSFMTEARRLFDLRT